MRSILTFSFLFFFFVSGAHALTLFVQTPTAAGAPALVVWTRDPTADGAGDLRFDLRFVSTGNATTSSSNTTASASTTAPASTQPPTATAASAPDSNATATQENTFVVQARADGDSLAGGSDAGLALANIRLLAGSNAGSSNVFFPATGSYLVTAVSGKNVHRTQCIALAPLFCITDSDIHCLGSGVPSGVSIRVSLAAAPSNTPIGTSNAITVTDTPAAAALSATPSPSATPSSTAPTPTTAPALTTITPSATPTPAGGPVSAAASPSGKKHPNLPAIIGSVLGTLVALALLATLVFLLGRRRQLREKRRLTFHREWMVQSSESVRNLNANNGGSANVSEDGHGGASVSGHGHGIAGLGAGPSRNASTGSSASTAAAARMHANTAGLLVPPSPFICVTPPPEDLETGLARNTVASRTAPKKLRLHMYTNDTDLSPISSPTTATTANNDGTRPLPAGAAPPTMYTPTMLANARNVASSMHTSQGGIAMPTPMRQTSTTPVTTALARMSSIHAHPGASPMGPRAPSPSPAAATNGSAMMDIGTTTPTSPFPPQLPPLNLHLHDDEDMEAGRKPPASAPARSMSFPVKTVTVRTEAVGRAATTTANADKGKGKAALINTLATRPASPRLIAPSPVASGSGSSSTPAALTTPANRKTPRQHLLAARLAILQNQMAEILSAPDSVHSTLVLADMRRQVAWLAEHERGDWAMGRTDERPAGWARVMTP
ncbi:hypothetical protein D9619_003838 [Psilocybe cf. subviscida]|uniref:Mid2 domain-containing protein n=1 Tax=Psilocybe cf. subviscida TaxID=2480587 RepID=A0A8H5EU43_9AGAR|nr:hypothetical protein D9619_003838 [Psilocybe cf. subviscida]